MTPSRDLPAQSAPGGLGRLVADRDSRYLLLLLLLSAATHLIGLAHPPSVVFDEFHFGRFVTAYCCDHQRFFDVHPPHAKLLIAGVARLFGYTGGLSFEAIGQSYGAISALPLRLAPALAGMALPLILFTVLRQLGGSPVAALFGGLLVVFDNALTAHTRFIGLDGILLAAMFGALACHLAAARAASAPRMRLLAVGCGALLGLAAGSKLIGLAMVGLIGLHLLGELLRAGGRPAALRVLRRALWIGLGATAVYMTGWALHFALLSEPGPGDAWGLPSGQLLADTARMHVTMFNAHRDLSAAHPYGSPWWSWPMMSRPIFYWSGEGGAKIYLLGNPLVWWGGSLLLVGVLVDLGLAWLGRRGSMPEAEEGRPLFWLPIVGFFASYAPLADVSRVLFMYHYLAPLLFALLTVVLWLDHVGWVRAGGLRQQRPTFFLTIGLLVVLFAVLAPLTYGLELGAGLADRVFTYFPR